jgi:hypothetical protein
MLSKWFMYSKKDRMGKRIKSPVKISFIEPSNYSIATGKTAHTTPRKNLGPRGDVGVKSGAKSANSEVSLMQEIGPKFYILRSTGKRRL